MSEEKQEELWKPLNNFLISRDHCGILMGMEDEEIGRIIRYLYAFAETGEIVDISTESKYIQVTFQAMLARLIADKAHMNAKCQKLRQNAQKGGRQKALNAKERSKS